MGKANPDVSIPGAPAAPAASPETAASAKGTAAKPLTDGDAAADLSGQPRSTDVDPRDAEIAALRAQLAAANAAVDPSKLLVMEADGPNYRRYRAESKHLHLTTEELHAKVQAGEVRLTDHHVLCKDGWYVNPQAQKQANG